MGEDLGMNALDSEAYNCMGGCGPGCTSLPFFDNITVSPDDIGALDCLKHDLCSAWKTVFSGKPVSGFCHDPDCGDEAAMTIFNCWRGWRLFGSVGGSNDGPLAEPSVCYP